MLIVRPLITEEERTEVQAKIANVIEKSGKIVSTDVWGKRHLSYEIGGVDEGYYIVYKLELEASKVKDLTSKFELESNILRFLLSKDSK